MQIDERLRTFGTGETVPPPTDPLRLLRRGVRRRRIRQVTLSTAALAVVATAAGAVISLVPPRGLTITTQPPIITDSSPTPKSSAAETPTPGLPSWRLLLDEVDRRLSYVDVRDVGDHRVQGEYEFTRTAASVPDVVVKVWPGLEDPSRVADGEPGGVRDVAGQEATLLHEPGEEGHSAVWFDGTHTVAVQMYGLDAAERDQILDALHVVDAAQWSAALPTDVLDDDEAANHLQEALAELPLPAELEPGEVWNGGSITTTQLDAAIMREVACPWIAQWVSATEFGDIRKARTAGAALERVTTWGESRLQDPINQGMPAAIREYADAIGADGAGDGRMATGGTVEVRYGSELSCDTAPTKELPAQESSPASAAPSEQ